jgi:hypothetical protein
VTSFLPRYSKYKYNNKSKCNNINAGSSSKTALLYESSYPWEGNSQDQDLKVFQDEETLLKMHCKCMHSQSLTGTNGVQRRVQKYIQSFPFAAVLPVQPLQYMPTNDGGVEVLFLRKKTEEKGSIDGGLRFFIVKDKDTDDGLEILIKRFSKGQTVGKVFAEKLVVQAFVAAMTRKPAPTEELKEVVTDRNEPPTVDAITIESVYHKWMDLV